MKFTRNRPREILFVSNRSSGSICGSKESIDVDWKEIEETGTLRRMSAGPEPKVDGGPGLHSIDATGQFRTLNTEPERTEGILVTPTVKGLAHGLVMNHDGPEKRPLGLPGLFDDEPEPEEDEQEALRINANGNEQETCLGMPRLTFAANDNGRSAAGGKQGNAGRSNAAAAVQGGDNVPLGLPTIDF